MTQVVNLKYLSESWKRNPHYVYIGREGKGQEGYFGNPFRRHINSSLLCPIVRYEEYLKNRLATDLDFNEKFYNLKDKILVCFCKPEPCHGDIMRKYLDDLPKINVDDV